MLETFETFENQKLEIQNLHSKRNWGKGIVAIGESCPSARNSISSAIAAKLVGLAIHEVWLQASAICSWRNSELSLLECFHKWKAFSCERPKVPARHGNHRCTTGNKNSVSLNMSFAPSATWSQEFCHCYKGTATQVGSETKSRKQKREKKRRFSNPYRCKSLSGGQGHGGPPVNQIIFREKGHATQWHYDNADKLQFENLFPTQTPTHAQLYAPKSWFFDTWTESRPWLAIAKTKSLELEYQQQWIVSVFWNWKNWPWFTLQKQRLQAVLSKVVRQRSGKFWMSWMQCSILQNSFYFNFQVLRTLAETVSNVNALIYLSMNCFMELKDLRLFSWSCIKVFMLLMKVSPL